MSQLDQIKTALSDSACESVDINISGYPDSLYMELVNIENLDSIDDFEIESFEVNLREFEPLDVGDLVYTPYGNANIYRASGFAYLVKMCRPDLIEQLFSRRQLVLLEKANKGDSNE